MKAAVLYGVKDLRVAEIDKPELGPGQVLVRVESVGICGSDVHFYRDGRIGEVVAREPQVLGHEFAGVVEEVGPDVTTIGPGMRVAVEPSFSCGECEFCNAGRYNVCPNQIFCGMPPGPGALAEYIAVPARFCFPVPDSVSPLEAAMIEPLAVGVHAVELSGLRPGETVAVLGQGPIGILTMQVARTCGAGTIFATEIIPERIEAAKLHGADVAIDAGTTDPVEAILDATNGRGVDITFEAAGAVETPQQALDITAPGGRIVLIGICPAEVVPLNLTAARRKEFVMKWCRRFCHDFPRSIVLVERRAVDVASLVTHRFPLDTVVDAFELVLDYRDGVIKASVDF